MPQPNQTTRRRPEPFTGRGVPTFTVRELLPWFCISGGAFALFIWSIGL